MASLVEDPSMAYFDKGRLSTSIRIRAFEELSTSLFYVFYFWEMLALV